MERLLAVKPFVPKTTQADQSKPNEESKADSQRQAEYDVLESDLTAEEKVNEKSRLRYQRMFWEPVVEGKVSGNVICTTQVS